MALPIQTSTRVPVTLPLACDPLIRQANPVTEDGLNPLLRYLATSDETGLVVPEGATEIVIRALSRTEMAEAEAAAGRYRDDHFQVYMRAYNETMKRAAAGEERAILAALDALSDAEYEQYQAHERWLTRRSIERVRRGLLSISDFPDLKPGPRGFPVEEMMACPLGGGLDWFGVIYEVSDHIHRVSTLGKAVASSERSCGENSRGSSSATTATDAKQEPVMGGSLPVESLSEECLF